MKDRQRASNQTCREDRRVLGLGGPADSGTCGMRPGEMTELRSCRENVELFRGGTGCCRGLRSRRTSDLLWGILNTKYQAPNAVSNYEYSQARILYSAKWSFNYDDKINFPEHADTCLFKRRMIIITIEYTKTAQNIKPRSEVGYVYLDS